MADFLKKHWFRFLICILLVAGCIVVYNIFNSYENAETGFVYNLMHCLLVVLQQLVSGDLI